MTDTPDIAIIELRPGLCALLVPARKSRLRRMLGWCIPLRFWFTYRIPGDAVATITYPDGMPLSYAQFRVGVLSHEAFHVEQMRPWWGPYWALGCQIFPLPVLLSGRWFVEREPYLADIRAHRRTVEQAVETLWAAYWMPWPKPWMRRWFEQELAREAHGA